MCYACDFDPFELIRSTRKMLAEKAASEREMDKVEAILLKDSLKVIESTSNLVCNDGKDIKESLRQRQYELSRKL